MRGQHQAPAVLHPRERPGTHCTGGWVGPRAGLDRCGKSRPTGIRSPDRPARSQSLYRLSYRAQFCSSKAISVTYCECVFVALVIQRELRMRRIILMYLSFLFIPCFYILFQKRKYSQENGIDHKLCVCFDFPYKMCLKCFAF